MSSTYIFRDSQSKNDGKSILGISRQYAMEALKDDPRFTLTKFNAPKCFKGFRSYPNDNIVRERIILRKEAFSANGLFVDQINEAKDIFESYEAQNPISLDNGSGHKILSPRQVLKGDCVSNDYPNGGNKPFVGLKLGNKYGGGWEKGYQKLCGKYIRHRVKDTLELFRQELRKFQQENKGKPRIERGCSYTIASDVLKKKGRWLNTDKCIGSVLGVEIGDEFQSKMELRIVGLHHRQFCGIDYLVQDGVKLATSVVATGRYANKMEGSNILVYIGEGGNPNVQSKRPLKDQKLERGNLALKNNIEHKTPVRVIRHKESHRQNARKLVYVYEGLHLVETYRQCRGKSGKLVFKFFLRKISDNTFDENEKVSSIKENLEQSMKPSLSSTRSTTNDGCGCGCGDGCFECENCSCIIKNNGKMPYDSDGCLVRKLSFVYECGPSCKCSLSCMNRVSQRGTQAKLELFKNKISRYGVRSKSYILKGSFICKYVPRKEFLGKEIPEGNNNVTMDVSEYADVGRFIGNSGSPTLYGQEIIIDHKSHLMLFAMRNISPWEELTIGYMNQILNT